MDKNECLNDEKVEEQKRKNAVLQNCFAETRNSPGWARSEVRVNEVFVAFSDSSVSGWRRQTLEGLKARRLDGNGRDFE